MLCPACGAERPADANFCPRCGARLVEGAPGQEARALERARVLIEATRASGAGRDLNGLLEAAERVRARAEANEARLATIVEHLPCGVLILDALGKVIMINEAGRRIAGQAPSGTEPLSEQQETYRVRDPRTGQPFERGDAAIERALRGELVEAQETLFRRPGEEADLRLQTSAAPLSDRAGAIRGAVVVYTDVTELHRAIGERARLDGAVKTARLITHELNNKLTAVVANADLLLGMLDGEALQFAEEILRGAEEAAAIVARLNQIVRVEEADLGLGVPVLDLEASTQERHSAA